MVLVGTVFWAVVVIGVLVFVHEWGHYLMARLLKVRVLVFSVGFGPRVWGVLDRSSGTEFVVSAVPLGGYVRMLGESPFDPQPIAPEDRPYAFSLRPVLHRVAIVLAGPVSNILFAVLVLAVSFLLGREEPLPVVGGVTPGMPAEAAGLRPGDRVTHLDAQPVVRWETLSRMIRSSSGDPLEVTVERGKTLLTLRVTPRVVEGRNRFGEPVREVRIGIAQDSSAVAVTRYPPGEALVMGASLTWRMGVDTLEGIGKLLTRAVGSDQIGGPLLIAELAGRSAALGPSNFLNFMALISVNLGLLNLLPIPVLDGGHLLFYLVEVVKGGPLREGIQQLALQTGVVVLAFLMLLALYNDLMRMFS